MNSRYTKAVFLDLDGTLVDSAPDLAASVSYALTEIGIEPPDLDEVKSYVGGGAAKLIHRALTRSKDGIAEDALFESASAIFFSHYAANVCERSKLYPGVVETLERLRTLGFGLACVTNKPHRFTVPLLETLGLDSFFTLCLSGDSLAKKKPEPDQLLNAAHHFDLASAQCTMVGDASPDILAARNAGMVAIAVSYGYGDMEAMKALRPLAFVDRIDQIIEHLPASSASN